MANHSTGERLQALSAAMAGAGMDAYLVPMVDAFQSEYIAPSAARLPYITGFTGSAGFAVIWAQGQGARKHVLFVDGRYTLQAANEIDTDAIEILNIADVSFVQWLAGLGKESLRIGFDPSLITLQQYTQWTKAAAYAAITWVAHTPNLIDELWQDQPAAPAGPIHLHPLEYAGVAYAQKREPLLAAMEARGADALLLTQPDAINWLLNIRGEDIDFNPLVLGYFLLTREGAASFYTEPRELTAQVKEYFAQQQVSIVDIAKVFAGETPKLTPKAKVMMDAGAVPFLWQILAKEAGWHVIEAEDPTQLPKALKNEAELGGIREAHRRDGLALTRFLHWFDTQMEAKRTLDELTIIAKLEAFRAEGDDYRGPSFATIAGAGPHGAIIHYRADEASNRKLQRGELLLLDSGGQYPQGTTDVTRTITTTVPTSVMKEHFTRVLKGHIALASVQFPVGTTGGQLDVLARQYLWAVGLDYDHGTGHGVGAYLCVHEGPQRISKRGSNVALKPGMILSNEPGYYAAGQYGIRIENLVVVVAGKGSALAFETLTLAPIDTRLIEIAMLTNDERNWLNQYHSRIYKTHADGLDYSARQWLERATRAI